MPTRFFTKPVIFITFHRSEVFAQHSADVVGHSGGHNESVMQYVIDAVENKFHEIQCYVEYRDNQPFVKMTRTARQLLGNDADTQIANIVGFLYSSQGLNHEKI